MDTVTIRLYDVVGNSFCVAVEDGQRVYEAIRVALMLKKRVVISCRNIEMFTASFLNSAIGQLYNKEFDYSLLSDSLTVEECQEDDLNLRKRVIDTAKLFYSDPNRLSKTLISRR